MKLLKELNRVIDELDIITKRINKTNNESLFEDNITIADAICTRDTIKKKRNAIVAIIEEATIKVDRYSQSEVKFISTISIEQLQKQSDLLAKEFREIDMKIQEKNWTTAFLKVNIKPKWKGLNFHHLMCRYLKVIQIIKI